MPKEDKITKISEDVAFKGNLITIINRKFKIYKKNKTSYFTVEIAKRPPGVRLIIVRNKKILLNKEYRSELGKWDYRLAGGKIFDSLDDFLMLENDPKKMIEMTERAVRVEGLEESGIHINNQKFFQKSASGSTIEWDLYYYLVEDFKVSPTGNEQEEAEIIEPEWFSFSEAVSMCMDGSISEYRSVGILLKYLLNQIGTDIKV